MAEYLLPEVINLLTCHLLRTLEDFCFNPWTFNLKKLWFESGEKQQEGMIQPLATFYSAG